MHSTTRNHDSGMTLCSSGAQELTYAEKIY